MSYTVPPAAAARLRGEGLGLSWATVANPDADQPGQPATLIEARAIDPHGRTVRTGRGPDYVSALADQFAADHRKP